MTTFAFLVTVECDTLAQAERVMIERIQSDEDYGFTYSIDWNGSTPSTPVAQPREGLDRCGCGSKYWDGTRCHSCGEAFVPPVMYTPESDNPDDEEWDEETIANEAWSNPQRMCVGCFMPMVTGEPDEHSPGCPTGQNGPPRY